MEHDGAVLMKAAGINRLVAEHVMGWKWDKKIECWYSFSHHSDSIESREAALGYYRDPSITLVRKDWNAAKDISAAWEVVEKMRGEGFSIAIKVDGDRVCVYDGRHSIWGDAADTAPEAICRAALKAKGVEVDS